MKIKRIIALVLSLVMILSCIPNIEVYAVDAPKVLSIVKSGTDEPMDFDKMFAAPEVFIYNPPTDETTRISVYPSFDTLEYNVPTKFVVSVMGADTVTNLQTIGGNSITAGETITGLTNNIEDCYDTVKDSLVANKYYEVDENYYIVIELTKVHSIKNNLNPKSSSKKYKATNTKDAAEKISGSGKKGSKRTITPVEGKKVASVVVTDKDGNEIDVTMNEDGTYSFKQPASNVNIEVTYKNREITLNIGLTEAEVDGEQSNLDVCPVVRNDRTMLPIRFVAENLGAKVEWNEKNPNYVVINKGDTKIEITIGMDTMKVNDKEVKLDSVAFAENDRTYLPVRAISEALNAIVEWNEAKPMEVKIYERQ